MGTAALLALSLACNAIMLISSEAVWRMQMGGGLALFVPLCLLLLEGTRPEQGNKARWLVLVLAFWSFTEMFTCGCRSGGDVEGRDSQRECRTESWTDLMEEGSLTPEITVGHDRRQAQLEPDF